VVYGYSPSPLGPDYSTTCCTHGVSRAAPVSPSCLDDAEASPYVLQVAEAVQDEASGTTRFEMQVCGG
jgi:hypothetical protein